MTACEQAESFIILHNKDIAQMQVRLTVPLFTTLFRVTAGNVAVKLSKSRPTWSNIPEKNNLRIASGPTEIEGFSVPSRNRSSPDGAYWLRNLTYSPFELGRLGNWAVKETCAYKNISGLYNRDIIITPR